MKRYTILAAVAGVLALSACGDTTEAESSASTPNTVSDEAADEAVAKCKEEPVYDRMRCLVEEVNATTTTTTEPEYETFMYEVAAVTEAGEVGDDGTSITFDTEGEEDYSGDTIEGVAAALIMLGTPDHVIARMDQTRALDGTQDATWEYDGVDYAAFWNYHPDSGVNLTVYEA
jgi:hypothetical protein